MTEEQESEEIKTEAKRPAKGRRTTSPDIDKLAAMLSPATGGEFVVPKRIASRLSAAQRASLKKGGQTVVQEEAMAETVSPRVAPARRKEQVRQAAIWATVSVVMFLVVLGWGFTLRDTILASINLSPDTAAASIQP